MADLTITASSVKPVGANAQVKCLLMGESVAQGDVVYLDSSDNKYYKADADLSQASATATGICLTPASADGYSMVMTSGTINLGATLTKGELYCVSATGGKIAPFSDLVAGDWITFLGVAKSASELILAPQFRGVQI